MLSIDDSYVELLCICMLSISYAEHMQYLKAKHKLSMVRNILTLRSHLVNYSGENFLTARNFFLTMRSCSPSSHVRPHYFAIILSTLRDPLNGEPFWAIL